MSPARRTVLRLLANEADAAGDHDTVRDCYALLDGNDEDAGARRRILRVLREAAERAEERWDEAYAEAYDPADRLAAHRQPAVVKALAKAKTALARWTAVEG